ncbi:CD63 antigen [Agrilus planipennis]|uniref:Tetraspanin n=1 Tax=Agrilus planipennis TaxID=224129 RepID=A0A1W4WL05_AGRPL|nr:CD63 antigen [Agrilus planipennis]
MGCCAFIGKYLLFLVNLAFALVGIAIVVVGAVYKYQFDNVLEALPDEATVLSLVPTLAIIVGCIVFFIAFLGCCGAVNEGKCMLSTYSVLIFVILIAQVGVGIYAFIQFGDNQGELRTRIHDQLVTTFNRYSTNTASREAVDFVQSELKCCGVDSSNFWTGTIPNSCCASNSAPCTTFTAYRTGCSQAIWEWLRENGRRIGIAAIVIAVFELICGIVACCQIRSINKRYHV